MFWTVEQRTVLFLLRTKFEFDDKTSADIFNHMYSAELIAAGYKTGKLMSDRVRDEYNSRKAHRRSTAWRAVDDDNQTAEEMQRREDLKDRIRSVAAELGVEVAEVDDAANENAEGDKREEEEENGNPRETEAEEQRNLGRMLKRKIQVNINSSNKRRMTDDSAEAAKASPESQKETDVATMDGNEVNQSISKYRRAMRRQKLLADVLKARSLTLLGLPNEILSKILRYVMQFADSYDDGERSSLCYHEIHPPLNM